MLGSTLIEWFSTIYPSRITQAVPPGVSNLVGLLAGGALSQGNTANQPVLNATGWNSLYSDFDFAGTTTTLSKTNALPAQYPVSANASEIWALIDQRALTSSATQQYIFCYGGSSSTTWRGLARNVVSSQNRVQAVCGTGSATVTETLAADFSGRHAVCAIFDGTNIYAGMDGTLSSGSACVPGTAVSGRVRMGADAASTGAHFALIGVREIFLTSATNATQRSQIWAYLAGRT